MGNRTLIIVPSNRMDVNRKEDRRESSLIRISKLVRESLCIKDDVLILQPKTEDVLLRIKQTVQLKPFLAYASDLKYAKEKLNLSDEDMKRVGFVTSNTFKSFGGEKSDKKEMIIPEDIDNIIIGADPEFLLFDNDDKIVHANNVMGKDRLIGSDGAMAELRPAPGLSPEDLAENILKLFKDKEQIKPIKDYKWVASCFYKNKDRDYPVGGHIHIGNPTFINKIPIEKRRLFFHTLNKIIDELLSVPMVKLDGKTEGRARRIESRMGHYGFFGGMRTDLGRLEHRTLSGMWLMHPILSIYVFGVVKAIVDEVYKRVETNKFDFNYMFNEKFATSNLWAKEFDSWKEFKLLSDMGCVLDSKTLIDILHNSRADLINTKFMNEWLSKMKDFSTYKIYSRYIDGFHEVMSKSSKVLSKCNRDIKSNWLDDTKFI